MNISNIKVLYSPYGTKELIKLNDFSHFARILSNQRNISYCIAQLYPPLRATLISEIVVKIAFPEQISDDKKFIALLITENIVDQVGNYIQKALHCRRFLLSKHKNSM